MTASDAIQAAINIAKAEIGYREKASNANLDSKTANAGTANYTKYWRDVAPEYQGQAWCACFISWVFMKAFNKSKASELLKHWPYISVPNISTKFTNYSTPKAGDIVMYHNGRYLIILDLLLLLVVILILPLKAIQMTVPVW